MPGRPAGRVRSTVLSSTGEKDIRGGANNETRHILNGIVRCAGCARLMSGRGYKQKDQPRVIQYQCQRNHTIGTCPAPANVNDSVILPYVEQAFFDYIGCVSPWDSPQSSTSSSSLWLSSATARLPKSQPLESGADRRAGEQSFVPSTRAFDDIPFSSGDTQLNECVTRRIATRKTHPVRTITDRLCFVIVSGSAPRSLLRIKMIPTLSQQITTNTPTRVQVKVALARTKPRP